jgi:apolipoprotein N-acyltransferase
MILARVREGLPGWKNVLLALLSAVLLVLAFPDFDLWWIAWFALVPLMLAVEREKDSMPRATIIGWIFGTSFFFGSCWWLTFAPITYAGFPPIVAYLLLFFAAAGAGIFPGIFAGLLAYLLRRFGSVAMLAAPFVWVATEFARYWITGNNWNALGYSQAFSTITPSFARVGGVLFVSFVCMTLNVVIVTYLIKRSWTNALLGGLVWVISFPIGMFIGVDNSGDSDPESTVNVIAIQPNVPMAGLTYERWQALRQRHVRLAESTLATLTEQRVKHNERPIRGDAGVH